MTEDLEEKHPALRQKLCITEERCTGSRDGRERPSRMNEEPPLQALQAPLPSESCVQDEVQESDGSLAGLPKVLRSCLNSSCSF